jgi:adenylosuccinate synthase
MPVSVVVGGQYGSEGKGKVALALRRQRDITFVVRPGGTNSGHTGYDRLGRKIVLRQFPAAAIDRDVNVVFPAGSYIDVPLFLHELKVLGLPRSRVLIDRRAHLILPEHRAAEAEAGLVEGIGSTGSGTGASVISRIARYGRGVQKGVAAEDDPDLTPFTEDVPAVLSEALSGGERILIEGTQGFGLSPLHGDCWPKATSRDTTAAGFLSEAGLPLSSVDEVVLVLRTYPIRVAGDSGTLLNELSWEEVTLLSGSRRPLHENTSVTNKLRRIGRFDPAVVRRAIICNGPDKIVLNHLDHVDATLAGLSSMSPKASQFVRDVEERIGQRIDFVGTGPTDIIQLPIHEAVGNDRK